MANNGTTNGISLGTLIFVIFLILKLSHTGAIANWSWWWITSPLWLPIGINAALLTLLLIAKSFKK